MSEKIQQNKDKEYHMNQSLVLGVDIGGSHITSALVNLETRTILKETLVRNLVNANGTEEEILSSWVQMMQESLKGMVTQDKMIGIAMPGPFDYLNGISLMKGQNKFDALYGLNVKQILAGRLDLQKDSIRFINDAESFLAGEVFAGAAIGAERAIGLTLGTGLGSALYKEGNCADVDLWCAPFLDGIAEDYLSTRWFIKRYQERTGKSAADVKELTSRLSTEPEVICLFKEFGKHLALFLNDFISKHQPEVVVLGGNIVKAYEFFQESLQGHLKKQSFSFLIKRTTLGEEACLLGAASCWQTRRKNLSSPLREARI